MKVLVFGKTGQVAQDLARRLPDGVTAEFLGREEADLLNPSACAAIIAATSADVVINAAAWTAVDKAETEVEAATLVNATTPATMAEAAAARGLPFLHISTDYVFDGAGDQPFHPQDPTGPLGVYGRTKLAGEDGVRAAAGQHLILRTSWVFSAHGANFVKTMLRVGATRDHLTVVGDQTGGPTPAADIADALLSAAGQMVADRTKGGTHHFSGAPDTTWAGFAREIFARSGLSVTVEDIPSSAYPTPAKRPGNSRMHCSALARDFGIARPDWRDGLDSVLRDLDAPA